MSEQDGIRIMGDTLNVAEPPVRLPDRTPGGATIVRTDDPVELQVQVIGDHVPEGEDGARLKADAERVLVTWRSVKADLAAHAADPDLSPGARVRADAATLAEAAEWVKSNQELIEADLADLERVEREAVDQDTAVTVDPVNTAFLRQALLTEGKASVGQRYIAAAHAPTGERTRAQVALIAAVREAAALGVELVEPFQLTLGERELTRQHGRLAEAAQLGSNTGGRIAMLSTLRAQLKREAARRGIDVRPFVPDDDSTGVHVVSGQW